MRKPVTCEIFGHWLVHYQADEVPEDDRRSLEDHLHGCDGCQRRLALENGFLEVIRARMPRVPAPPGLETRVRAALESSGPRASAGSWLSRPWFAAVAASLLLAILLVPGIGDPVGLVRSVTAVSGQIVTVIDRDCAEAGYSIEQQRRCRMPHHLNVLLRDDGSYWNLSLDREINKMILLDPEMRGHRLVVDGDLYGAIHTLGIRDYRDLDRDDEL